MKRNKRIGIDARFYSEAGPGRYAKNIVEHLEKLDNENEYFIFLRKKGWDKYQPINPNFKKILADYPWYSWKEQTLFLLKLLSSNLDLFYVPHFNVPVLYPGTLITAIPDIIMHTFSTEAGTTLPKPYFKIKKLVYKKVVSWVVKRSKKVIVPSYDTLNDFVKTFPKEPKNKFVMVYEGVDPVFSSNTLDSASVKQKYGIPDNFLLYVSSMYEHKNVPGLLSAFKILKEKYGYKGSLVLIGKKDKFSERVNNLVTELDLSSSVLLPGMKEYVSDPEVVSLRKAAQLCVFPSLKEGFSLTPLESQQVGLACVISDIPCHREIYRDSVVYFDPKDSENMALKINDVLQDNELINQLISKGYENVKKYSWFETAGITLKVFTEVLK